MKVIIAGGRKFDDYKILKREVLFIMDNLDISEIVSGVANGADKLGERFANEFGIPIKRFPANWQKLGRSAGYKRNAEMAAYADALIAFWDGKSKGTKHMIDLAKNKNLKVTVITYDN